MNFLVNILSNNTPLAGAATWTGEWYDARDYDSIVFSCKADVEGTLYAQFSNDGSEAAGDTVPSQLAFAIAANIDEDHRVVRTRRYFRLRYVNGATGQASFNVQTFVGEAGLLSSPLNSSLQQDADAVAVRESDFHYEVALGRRQGHTTWNKFGFNADADIGTETIWSVGGTFTPIVTARTLSVVSTDANDTSGGTGARSLVVYGVDANWEEQIVVVTLNGTAPVVTTETWMGVNRIAIYLAGTGKANAGTITATATSEATIQARIEVGAGTTQQCFYFVPVDSTALLDWINFSLVKNAGGTQPKLTIKAWITSAVSNAKYEVYREYLNGSVENHVQATPSQPFVVGEKSLIEFQCTTDVDNTEVSCRFSLILVSDVGA